MKMRWPTPIGRRSDCPPRRNGNLPRGGAWRGKTMLGGTNLPMKDRLRRISGSGSSPIPMAWWMATRVRPPSKVIPKITTAFLTWPEMSGSGARIGIGLIAISCSWKAPHRTRSLPIPRVPPNRLIPMATAPPCGSNEAGRSFVRKTIANAIGLLGGVMERWTRALATPVFAVFVWPHPPKEKAFRANPNG